MFDNLEIMRMAQGLARHASSRQDLVARNIANADTPGYRAQDLVQFEALYEGGTTEMRATRAGHFGVGGEPGAMPSLSRVEEQSSPNGNAVSLEAEMVRSAEVRHQHDLATTVYKTSLDILRTSLGRGR